MHHVASTPLDERLVARAPRANGFDASPDGTTVSVLLCDSRTLTRECLARGLTQEWPAADVLQISDVRQLGDFDDDFARCEMAIVNLGARAALAPGVPEMLDYLQEQSDAAVVMISDDESCASVTEAMRRGVRAYIGTMCSLPVLIGILQLVRLGGTYIPSTSLENEGVRPVAPAAPGKTVSKNPVVQTFTPREIEILEGLKNGKPNKIIAHELKISESTAKVHIRHIMGKLSVTNRTQAALLASQLLSGSD